MACRGFVAGYGNGYFGINDPVKRGQYTKMVDLPLRWAYPSSAPNPPSFNDIANSVFRLNIEQAYYKQVISGYADCNPSPCFRPENNISRAEMARLVASAAGWNDAPPSDNTFQDVPTTHWAFRYIEMLAARGAVAGAVSCGPSKPCDRFG